MATTVTTRDIDPLYTTAIGNLEINRRLSDKVLSAFNHAYAVGETDVAAELLKVLRLTESKRVGNDQRISYNAIEHADLWVGFVDAREAYRRVADGKKTKSGDLDAALSAMKDAYRAWSEA